MTTARTLARDQIRATLVSPHRVCAQLGLLDRSVRQAGGAGLTILCPAHNERTPSCSVSTAPDGTIRVHCFGCALSGDVFHLIAAAMRVSIERDFAAVLDRAAELTNVDPTAPIVASDRAPRAMPAPPVYPDVHEVTDLWSRALPLSTSPEAIAYLGGRAINVDTCELYDLARVLPADAPCPRWARFRGVAWSTASYRIVVPVYDHTGALRSLRAWRWEPIEDAPKRIVPADRSTVGLVMACPVARRMLVGAVFSYPPDVIIAEGEPDYLTHASAVSDSAERPPAILGVVSSAWAEAFADRIPDGARVYIRTHDDDAGTKYARTITTTLAARARAGTVTLYDRRRTTR